MLTVNSVSTLRFPIELSVVGVSWHQETIMLVGVGDEVRVEREPLNAFDPLARVVSTRWGIVGHLAAPVAARLEKEGVGTLIGEVVRREGRGTIGLKILVSEEIEEYKLVNNPGQGNTPTEEVRLRGSGRVLGVHNGEQNGVVEVVTDNEGSFFVPKNLIEVS